jgi:hypothetical protein
MLLRTTAERGVTGMKARRTGSTSRAALAAVGALALLFIAVIGSAQAAAPKKVYDATVRAAPGTTPTTGSAVLRLTLKNNAKSNQTLGSANVVAPSGVQITGLVQCPSVAPTSRSGWTVCQGTGAEANVVKFRSTSNPVMPGDSSGVYADVSVTITPGTGPGQCGNATWTAFAKQSNDFSGTGNDFTLGSSTNLRPLGSLTFVKSIGGVYSVGTEVDDPATLNVIEQLPVPQLAIKDPPAEVHITAKDACGAAYANYGAASGPNAPVTFGTGATLTRKDPATLEHATITTIAWTNGTGLDAGTGLATVDPAAGETETGDQLVVSDQFTDIADTSNEFDVVELICTVFDDKCQWENDKKNIHVDADPPSGGASLGIGFIDNQSFTCDNGTDPALGDSLIYINPRDYQGGDTQIVTLTYDKTIKGTSGPVTSFQLCLSKDNGATWTGPTWDGPIDDCTTDTPDASDLAEAPCIADRARVQGNLVITLFFDPHADPVGGMK